MAERVEQAARNVYRVNATPAELLMSKFTVKYTNPKADLRVIRPWPPVGYNIAVEGTFMSCLRIGFDESCKQKL